MRPRGFTLIEASVVLVIVALLLTAILQGQSLIEGARYKSLKRDIGDYREAFEAFRQRYNALPGDFAAAESRLGLAGGADGNGNGVIDGGPACDSSGEEACRSWQHLRGARLIAGDDSISDTTAPPEHDFQGRFSAFFSGTEGNGEFGNKLLIEDLPAEFAIQLDEQLDDGIHDAGLISCESGCSGGWPSALDALVDVVYAL
ncbi:MAG: prepilin-type N-terminal cleavage/methylation domain-containing protein [Halofilum sp. (in: g-proteobacteria)]|nr:prepilin-type N-terminal cleavage/methylation domain-containing protein [Halofilum sp. (in: g-proteobacteria)]